MKHSSSDIAKDKHYSVAQQTEVLYSDEVFRGLSQGSKSVYSIPWGFRVVSEITRNWLDLDSMIAHVDMLEIIANLVDNLHLFLSCFVNPHLGKTMSCSIPNPGSKNYVDIPKH